MPVYLCVRCHSVLRPCSAAPAAVCEPYVACACASSRVLQVLRRQNAPSRRAAAAPAGPLPLGDDARYFGWSGDDLEIAGVFPKGLMRAAGAAPSEGSGRFPIGKGGGVVRVVENERAT